MSHSMHHCAICNQSFPLSNVIAAELVNKELTTFIRHIQPNWSVNHFICHTDLALIRTRYVHSLLTSEKQELTSLEEAVIKSLHTQECLSTQMDTDVELEKKWTLAERISDKIAVFGGSWSFIILFMVFLLIWIGANSVILFWKPSDPYPFIFLNLILSCLTAIQAPIIMMSQNRQESKDRVRSEHDYKINLKAELEIRHLHEKIDHVLLHQWEKMAKIQEVQLELLAELNHYKKSTVTHQSTVSI